VRERVDPLFAGGGVKAFHAHGMERV
jgi:hypothetical protein